MQVEHVFDLLPGYVLGSLDDDELIQVSKHLPHCATCQAELEGYRTTADRLVFAANLRQPAPDLRARVIAAVERSSFEKRSGAAVRGGADHKKGGFWDGWLNRPLGLSLAVLAAVLVLFLAASNLLLWQQVRKMEANIPQDKVQIVRLASTNAYDQAQAYLVLFPGDEYGTLVVNGAPQLDPHYQYQIWLIRDGKRTSGGVFSVDKHGYGALIIDAKQPLDHFQSFGITVEPYGGSPGPTGKKIFGGDL